MTVCLWLAYSGWWFDDFRADPRFQALPRRMNFPETAASAGSPETTTSR